MKVYVIGGKAGSGKSEAALYIKNYYEAKGKKACITEISKYIKIYAKELLNWNGDRETKPREFLQSVGYIMRHELFGDDFIINRTIEDTKVYERFVDVLIISDARLPIEIDTFKEKLNAVSIKVINSFEESKLSVEEQKHETEVAFDNYDNFDYVIYNDDINLLKSKVEEIIEKEDVK